MRLFILCALTFGVALQTSAAPAPPPQPPLRSRVAMEAILGKPVPPRFTRPLNIVLVASKQDHGPGEHDYPAWQQKWNALLSGAPRTTVTNAWLWPTAEQFTNANVLVFFYWNHAWSPEKFAQLTAHLQRRGGIVLLHSSSIADTDPESLAKELGIAFQPKRSKYRHGELDLKITAEHPTTRSLPKTIHFLDETYWPMIGELQNVSVLATADEEGKAWPMVWTYERDNGKIFGTVLGHYTTTHDDPFFRIMILRAIAWSVREPVSRFESLATVGVQFKD
jgi:type 1 glutamine amidotransferase